MTSVKVRPEKPQKKRRTGFRVVSIIAMLAGGAGLLRGGAYVLDGLFWGKIQAASLARAMKPLPSWDGIWVLVFGIVLVLVNLLYVVSPAMMLEQKPRGLYYFSLAAYASIGLSVAGTLMRLVAVTSTGADLDRQLWSLVAIPVSVAFNMILLSYFTSKLRAEVV